MIRKGIASLFFILVSFVCFYSLAFGFFEAPSELPEFPFWKFFQASLIIAFVVLYGLLFFANRSRQQRILASGRPKKKEKESPLFTSTQVGWVIGISIYLLIAGGVLLYEMLMWGIVFWVAGVVVLFYFFPTAIYDVKRTVVHHRSEKKSKHLIKGETTTFKDVGGLEEVIAELREVISLYKDPEDAEAWGIRPTKGILFTGPTGCGKTLLARAVAGETGFAFLAYSAAEIGNMFVRSGAQGIKGVFEEAKQRGRCILFLDELDALGKRRGMDSSGEFDHALTQLLHEMDGFQRDTDLLVIAATNREDMLDDALLRPGRFDKKILIPPPDVAGRRKVLEIHTVKKRLASNVNLNEIALQTPGFNCATLEQLTNEATQLARRRWKEERENRNLTEVIKDSVKGFFNRSEKEITKADFEDAMLKMIAGLERKLVMSEEERRTIAYHEMGHAIIAKEMGLEMLKKVTIMPRNWALGITLTSQGEERYSHQKKFVIGRITICFGGRAAEEIFFGEEGVTTGAADDFDKADEFVKKMICEWGMGKKGVAIFYKLGAGEVSHRPFSEYAAAEIDKEVQEFKAICYENAKRIIEEKKEIVKYLAEELLKRVVLDADEIEKIIKEQESVINN